MHTITLKSDDNFFEMLNTLVKNLNTTRSELIRNAVLSYKENLEKENLRNQIRQASLKCREESQKIAAEFDVTLNDGLENV